MEITTMDERTLWRDLPWSTSEQISHYLHSHMKCKINQLWILTRSIDPSIDDEDLPQQTTLESGHQLMWTNRTKEFV
jgi:hypothetical protein